MSQPPSAPHVGASEIERFRRRTLAGDELVAFAEHLDRCERCRQRVADSGDAAASGMLLEAGLGLSDRHPSEEDIHGYVNGTVDPERRADIQLHLEHCASCADEIRDLDRFAQHDRAASRRGWWSAGLAAA